MVLDWNLVLVIWDLLLETNPPVGRAGFTNFRKFYSLEFELERAT